MVSNSVLVNKFDSIQNRHSRIDYVYIFKAKSGTKKVYKIGHTWRVDLRLRVLKRSHKLSNIKLLYVIRSESVWGSLSLEKRLLSKFTPYLLPDSREWFSELPNIQEVVNEVV